MLNVDTSTAVIIKHKRIVERDENSLLVEIVDHVR